MEAPMLALSIEIESLDPKPKHYRLVRDSHRMQTLHVGASRLPLVLSGDAKTPYPLLTVAFTLLLDYFGNEEGAEIKARLLARPLSIALRKFGDEWTLSEAELNDLVMKALVATKNLVDEAAEDFAVEYIGGIRRDTLRLK